MFLSREGFQDRRLGVLSERNREGRKIQYATEYTRVSKKVHENFTGQEIICTTRKEKGTDEDDWESEPDKYVL
jgi:hypothetical protein